jgi:hypothetical protein
MLKGKRKMTDSQVEKILQGLSEKLDGEMRFDERDAVDYVLALMARQRYSSMNVSSGNFDYNKVIVDWAKENLVKGGE